AARAPATSAAACTSHVSPSHALPFVDDRYPLFLFSSIPPPPTFTPFPYTTLFRSGLHVFILARRMFFIVRFRVERAGRMPRPPRSEEHTSELQSPYDLVCRLLLEKKKANTAEPLPFATPPASST